MNPREPTLRTEYATRDSIRKLLSAAELAAVSTTESRTRLSSGDEYLDLEHLDRGVRRANGTVEPMMTTLLAKKSESDATWSRIVAQLVTLLTS